MVRVCWLENPSDTPAIWISNPAISETPVNEPEDDYYVILLIRWDSRTEPVEVVNFGIGESGLRETLQDEFSIQLWSNH